VSARKRSDGFVALTHCFFCGEADRILLDRSLGDISEAHGKALDMEPCAKCQKWMDEGVILLGIVPEKSEPGWNEKALPNPYRSGGFAVVKEEAVRRMFNDEGGAVTFALKHRWVFIDHKAGVMTGVWPEPKDAPSAESEPE
jgi:hypothetical protein